VADYRRSVRVGHLKPVPMAGGTKAILEPWRNAYAQLSTHFGWERVRARWPGLELTAFLAAKPLGVLDAMIARGLNAPLSSSCGRLFDAVAAALGICREGISYEGQAAIELEVLALAAPPGPTGGYPFALERTDARLVLDPAPMWAALLGDLAAGVDPALIAARFHRGLADAIVDLAVRLAGERGLNTAALSGGVLQNRTLFEALAQALRGRGLTVLAHALVPPNDGGLALGQAAIAARCRD
jgi:hydrogenase maturation protein HypF